MDETIETARAIMLKRVNDFMDSQTKAALDNIDDYKGCTADDFVLYCTEHLA